MSELIIHSFKHMKIERHKKLEHMAQQLVSEFIFQELENKSLDIKIQESFGLITITGVKISSDLSYLDVFVSSIKNQGLLTKTLAKHCDEIQRNLNKAIEIRKLPRIRFRYDDSGAVSQEIYDLIKKECNN